MANSNRTPQNRWPSAMNPWRPRWLHDDPAHWRPGTLDRAALQADAAALAGRPGFDALAQRFARHWLATHEAHPALRAVMRNTPRYLALVCCLVLHHRRDPADPRSGITPGRVLDFFDQTARGAIDSGAWRVKSMLAHATARGLLRPVAGPGDARFRPMEPAPAMQLAMCQWVLGFLRAAEGVLPMPADPPALVAVPRLVGEVFSYRLAALNEDRFVLTEGMTAMRWVMQRDNGYSVFLRMLEAMQRAPDGSAHVPLQPTELAARAGVARATVRNLLADARAQGWLDDATPGIGLRLQPEPLRAGLHWIALELVWMHGLACAAWARLTRS